MNPLLERRILTPPRRWSRRSWGLVEPDMTTVSTRQPLSVDELGDHMGEEYNFFGEQGMISDGGFAKIGKTVIMYLRSAAKPQYTVRASFTLQGEGSTVLPEIAVLHTDETIRQQTMGVKPGQESGAALARVVLPPERPMPFNEALAILEVVHELRPALAKEPPNYGLCLTHISHSVKIDPHMGEKQPSYLNGQADE